MKHTITSNTLVGTSHAHGPEARAVCEWKPNFPTRDGWSCNVKQESSMICGRRWVITSTDSVLGDTVDEKPCLDRRRIPMMVLSTTESLMSLRTVIVDRRVRVTPVWKSTKIQAKLDLTFIHRPAGKISYKYLGLRRVNPVGMSATMRWLSNTRSLVRGSMMNRYEDILTSRAIPNRRSRRGDIGKDGVLRPKRLCLHCMLLQGQTCSDPASASFKQ